MIGGLVPAEGFRSHYYTYIHDSSLRCIGQVKRREYRRDEIEKIERWELWDLCIIVGLSGKRQSILRGFRRLHVFHLRAE